MQMIEGRWQSTIGEGVRGAVFRSRAGDEVVQARDDGFSFSKLPPYTNFDEVIAAAKRYWPIYYRLAPVDFVPRVAVRYINQFVIPRSHRADEYLTAPATEPEDIAPHVVTGALKRLSLIDPGPGIQSTVIQVTEPVDMGTGVLIDIDSYRIGNFKPEGDAFWELFKELRDAKNRIFFGSIHELAAEAFDK